MSDHKLAIQNHGVKNAVIAKTIAVPTNRITMCPILKLLSLLVLLRVVSSAIFSLQYFKKFLLES